MVRADSESLSAENRNDSLRARGAVPFVKMHGLGNDFVVVHEREIDKAGRALGHQAPGGGTNLDLAKVARRICDRHVGIGADGFIVVRRSDRPDCDIAWSYFNSDGSTSVMCGNGLRCLGLYAVEHWLVQKNSFDVSTGKGPVSVTVVSGDEITSDLGEPILRSEYIPVAGNARAQVLKEKLVLPAAVKQKPLTVTCLSMGNPHCVIFNSPLSQKERETLSPVIQDLPFFMEGVNVEWVDLISESEADVFVWERGCGPTLACASGAAAVLVAGVLEGKLQREATIKLPGGKLKINWSEQDNHVRITGPATVSYNGEFSLAKFLEETQK